MTIDKTLGLHDYDEEFEANPFYLLTTDGGKYRYFSKTNTSMSDEEIDNYFDEIDNEKQKLISKFLNYKGLTK